MLKYDQVILGGGLSGLVCGILLAKAGQKVCIVEKNKELGGAISTLKLETNLGKKIDVNKSLFTLLKLEPKSSTYEVLKKCGVTDEIELLTIDNLYSVKSVERTYQVPYDYSSYCDILSMEYRQNSQDIEKFFALLVKYNKKRNKRGSYVFVDLINYTAFEFLYKHVPNEEFIKEFGLTLFDLGLSLREVNAFEYLNHLLDLLFGKRYYIKGGNKPLINSLIKNFLVHGGVIKRDYEVTDFIFNKNKGYMVCNYRGDNIFAKNFICTFSPVYFVEEIVKGVDLGIKFLERKFRDVCPSTSKTIIYFSLSSNEQIFTNYEFKITNVQVEGDDEVSSFINTLSNIRLYNMNFIESRLDSQHEGYIVIEFEDEITNWPKYESEKYFARQERIVEVIKNVLDTYFLNLSSKIVDHFMYTPHDIKKHTNSTDGSTNGFRSDKYINKMFHDESFSAIENIHFIGAFTYPGSGFNNIIDGAAHFCTRYLENRSTELYTKDNKYRFPLLYLVLLIFPWALLVTDPTLNSYESVLLTINRGILAIISTLIINKIKPKGGFNQLEVGTIIYSVFYIAMVLLDVELYTDNLMEFGIISIGFMFLWNIKKRPCTISYTQHKYDGNIFSFDEYFQYNRFLSVLIALILISTMTIILVLKEVL